MIIDYKGFRVTAQSIIPGILEREQEQSVVYGSIDFGKTIVTSADYTPLLEKVAKSTRQQVHQVKNSDGEEKTMFTSVETKGIQGWVRKRAVEARSWICPGPEFVNLFPFSPGSRATTNGITSLTCSAQCLPT